MITPKQRENTTFIPWSFETRPQGVVWVFRRHFITDCMIVVWGDDVVGIATKHGIEKVGYGELFRLFLQRDGSPCGQEVNKVPQPIPPEPTAQEPQYDKFPPELDPKKQPTQPEIYALINELREAEFSDRFKRDVFDQYALASCKTGWDAAWHYKDHETARLKEELESYRKLAVKNHEESETYWKGFCEAQSEVTKLNDINDGYFEILQIFASDLHQAERELASVNQLLARAQEQLAELQSLFAGQSGQSAEPQNEQRAH